MEKVAAVFGGGARVTDTKEYLDTVAIGRILAENGYWVKCGGYYGIMEAVSKGVSEVGGTVSGITCKTFPSAVGNKYLTETIVMKIRIASTMKKEMIIRLIVLFFFHP